MINKEENDKLNTDEYNEKNMLTLINIIIAIIIIGVFLLIPLIPNFF